MMRDGANSRNGVGGILEARLQGTVTPSLLPTASPFSLFRDNISANIEAEEPFNIGQAAACTRNTLKLNRPRRQRRGDRHVALNQRTAEIGQELVSNRPGIDTFCALAVLFNIDISRWSASISVSTRLASLLKHDAVYRHASTILSLLEHRWSTVNYFIRCLSILGRTISVIRIFWIIRFCSSDRIIYECLK